MHVLILEDDDAVAESLSEGLVVLDQRYNIRRAASLSEARDLLREEIPDIAVIDLGLPDANGCDVAISLHDIAPELPLVALTGQDFGELAIELAQHGVQDFLPKGQTSLPRLDQVLQLAAVRQEREKSLRRQACFDELTGAVNRTELTVLLEKAISHAQRSAYPGALVLIDVDDFKQINDTYGHQAGDAVLISLVRILESIVRSGDTVGRLGGDEFAVVFDGLRNSLFAENVAQKLSRATNFDVQFQGHPINVTTSMGIAVFPKQADSTERLFELADRAMYQAKSNGKARYAFY